MGSLTRVPKKQFSSLFLALFYHSLTFMFTSFDFERTWFSYLLRRPLPALHGWHIYQISE